MHKDVYVTETDAKPKTIIQQLRQQREQKQQENLQNIPAETQPPENIPL